MYLAWAGAVSDYPDTIGIAAAVARSLELDQGSYVTITPIAQVPAAASVTVEPASADDWEVVELNAGAIEAEFLSQTGVASVEQPLMIWVHGQPLPFTVTSTTPAAPVTKLIDGTEISIAPRLSRTSMDSENGSDASSESSRVIRTALRLLAATSDLPNPLPGSNAIHDQGDKISSSKDQISEEISSDLPPGVAIAHVSGVTLQRCGLESGDWVECTAPRGGMTNACVLECTAIPPGHISVSDIGRASMGAEPFDSVKIRKLGKLEKRALVENAKREPEGGNPEEDPILQSYLSGRWHPPQMSTRRLQSASYGGDLNEISKQVPRSQRPAADKLLEAILPILAAGPRSVLQTWGAPRPGSVLVAGPPGTGKSSLLRLLCSVLSSHPHTLADIYTVPCREIHSESDAEKLISRAVAGAVARMPAIVLLEDIDVLCPSAPENEAHPGEEQGENHGAIITWLCEILDGIITAGEQWAKPVLNAGLGVGSWPAIAVIGTCRHASGVAPLLREVGRFETVIDIESPTIESRTEMLVAGISARGLAVDPGVLDSIALHADGFDGADIGVLLDRAMNLAVSKQLRWGSQGPSGLSASPLRLEKKDLDGAMAGMIPAAFWGSGTRNVLQAGVQGWQDVGGMSAVQEALREALELPLKHAALVATAPLRLRTGVLLYGPPGCGKTHIVAAAVAATGVRCITVSGPELLNKYIGASEAAVRDVFRRAAAAAPSVLFFDEFDAIAPQRGHDNTGVTDRVVNQLLTELDGVEGLKGVCVVGATSRPDLIDAALLRPGRLDRLLHCGFPTETEREDILRSLSRRLPLAKDADLTAVAAAADGFSGADLGAVLSEAQLAAAHEALDATSNKGGKIAVTLSQRHLETALKSARPSVSMAERSRLANIYQRFETGGSFAEPVVHGGAGKKVSWA